MPRPWRCHGEPGHLLEAGWAGEGLSPWRGALRGERGSAPCPHVTYGHPALFLLACAALLRHLWPSPPLLKTASEQLHLLVYIFMQAQSSSPPSPHPLCRHQALPSPVVGLIQARPCCGMQGLVSLWWQPDPIHPRGVTPAPTSSVPSQGQEIEAG